MVKNISNPLNSRAIAQIINEDITSQGYDVSEADIRSYLSDNSFDDLLVALKGMKSSEIIPSVYTMSATTKAELIERDFLDPNSEDSTHSSEEVDTNISTRLRSINEVSQYENLKGKIMKGWSGSGSTIDSDFERFDQKFGKSMNIFKDEIQRDDLSDVQTFAVVLATDHLGMRESSRINVFHTIFGRHDHELDFYKELNLDFDWPVVMGMGYIETAKRFTVAAEIVELGMNIKNLSGLDTYSEDILKELFFQFFLGNLNGELMQRKVLWRWLDSESSEDMFEYLLPPFTQSVGGQLKGKLMMVSAAQCFCLAFDKTGGHSLKSLYELVKDKSISAAAEVLAEFTVDLLTSIALSTQIGTTLTNYFKDINTNPSTVGPFVELTVKYFNKVGNVREFARFLRANIRVGLNTSTGMAKNYLKKVGDEELDSTILSIVTESLEEYVSSNEEPYIGLKEAYNSIYTRIKLYISSLENQSKDVSSSKGEIMEKTRKFWDAVAYLYTPNPFKVEIIGTLAPYGLGEEINQYIVQTVNYAVYSVSGRDGEDGKRLFKSLALYYGEKYQYLGAVQTSSGVLKDSSEFLDFVKQDLVMMVVLVATWSKVYVNAVNSWTNIKSQFSKVSQLLTEFVLPNVLYWQRLPRDLVPLVEKSSILQLVKATNRLSSLEAISLLLLGGDKSINSLPEAKSKVLELLSSDSEEDIQIDSNFGEAQIAKETILVVNYLAGDDRSMLTGEFKFPPVELATFIHKGFIHEFKDRHWFDQIYLTSQSLYEEEESYAPLIYKFNIHAEGSDRSLPDQLLLTFHYPQTRRLSTLAGVVIIGGAPDVFKTFVKFPKYLPVMESTIFSKYDSDNTIVGPYLENILNKSSHGVKFKPLQSIMEQAEQREFEDLVTFYPTFTKPSSGANFSSGYKVDCVFSLAVTNEFFNTEKIGSGIKKVSYYKKEDSLVSGKMLYPLVLKLQPILNDILVQLTQYSSGVLPRNFSGYLEPSRVVLTHEDGEIALMFATEDIDSVTYITVAVMKSGHEDGLPLSMVELALSREKFGSEKWYSMVEAGEFSVDSPSIGLNLSMKDVTIHDENGKLDLGLVFQIK